MNVDGGLFRLFQAARNQRFALTSKRLSRLATSDNVRVMANDPPNQGPILSLPDDVLTLKKVDEAGADDAKTLIRLSDAANAVP
jgi:hypothetical protein